MLIFTQLLRNYRELFGENAKNRRHLGAGFLLNDRKLLFVSIREQKKTSSSQEHDILILKRLNPSKK